MKRIIRQVKESIKRISKEQNEKKERFERENEEWGTKHI